MRLIIGLHVWSPRPQELDDVGYIVSSKRYHANLILDVFSPLIPVFCMKLFRHSVTLIQVLLQERLS